MIKQGIVSILLAVLMLCTAIQAYAQDEPAAQPTEDQAEFHDVILGAEGIVEGYPDGTFKGNNYFSRYEASMVISRMWIRMMNEVMHDTPFSDWQTWEASLPVETWLSDLDPEHWAYGGVSTLETVGISIGYPDGTFQGEKYVTKAELAVMANRLYGQFEFAVDSSGAEADLANSIAEMNEIFVDVPSSHWAYEHLANLYVLGLVDVDENGIYRPTENITRYEMAVDMEQYLDRVIELLNEE